MSYLIDTNIIFEVRETNGLTLVTRNDRDVDGLGVTVLNPFKSAGNHRRS